MDIFRIKKAKLTSIFVLLYVTLVVFMPNAIRNPTTIYHIDSTRYLYRGWLEYSFSAIEIFAFLSFFLIKAPKDSVRIKYVILLILFKNFIRLVFGWTNIFEYNDYSLLLSFIVGYGCYLLLVTSRERFSTEDLLDYIIILNFLTQLVFVFTGRQMEGFGRYGALASDVGSVGVMCCQYIIYYLFARKSVKRAFIPIVASFISLILSGSRSNLLFSVAFIILFIFKLRFGIRMSRAKSRALFIIALAIIVLIPFADVLSVQVLNTSNFSQVIDRMLDSVTATVQRNSGYFDSNTSLSGRMMSFATGFNILYKNPLGISTSTIDLELRSIADNPLMTFPHSTLLSFYLLWGIAALICYVQIIILFIKAFNAKHPLWVLLLSTLIMFVIYGAPIINAKNYLWYILVFDYCKKVINNDLVIEKMN